MTYSFGNIIKIVHVHYLIAQIKTREIGLISLVDGNRWSDDTLNTMPNEIAESALNKYVGENRIDFVAMNFEDFIYKCIEKKQQVFRESL